MESSCLPDFRCLQNTPPSPTNSIQTCLFHSFTRLIFTGSAMASRVQKCSINWCAMEKACHSLVSYHVCTCLSLCLQVLFSFGTWQTVIMGCWLICTLGEREEKNGRLPITYIFHIQLSSCIDRPNGDGNPFSHFNVYVSRLTHISFQANENWTPHQLFEFIAQYWFAVLLFTWPDFWPWFRMFFHRRKAAAIHRNLRGDWLRLV